jgi:hypothetical protein
MINLIYYCLASKSVSNQKGGEEMKYVSLLSALVVAAIMLSGCGGHSHEDRPVILTGIASGGFIVEVYEEGYAGNDEHLVVSGTAGPDGNFSLTVPQEGVYDIYVMQPLGGNPLDLWRAGYLQSVRLTAPSTDVGVVSMLPAPPG